MSRRPAGLIVRREGAADATAIRAVHAAAFPTTAEADLVEAIRTSPGYVADMALVAELDGVVIGHIMLSTVTLDTGFGPMAVMLLAPLAVAPDRQRQGVGSALVIAALDTAEAAEEPLVLLLGHPWFYPRFGFKPASRFGIRWPQPVPDAAFMIKPLTTYRRELSGQVLLPPTFDGV